MKKVTNITLGGSVFVAEDDAYEKLSSYLTTIERSLNKDSDVKEIMFDIETAIAEKFMLLGRSDKHAVTIEDVAIVVAELGQPEDITHDDPQNTSNTKHGSSNEQRKPKYRRFYRDTDDAIIGGVASGIARYFDIDPVIVRLIFAITLLFGGTGIVAYIVLWIVIPPAETTPQKYAMCGERMTIAEIREHVQRKLHCKRQDCHTKTEKSADTSAWTKARRPIQKTFYLFGSIIRHVLRVIVLLIAITCIVLGILGIATLLSSAGMFWLGEFSWLPFGPSDAVTFLTSNTSGHILLGAIFVAIFIPFLAVLIFGAGMLSGKKYFSMPGIVTLSILWFMALTFAVLLSLGATLHIQERPHIEEQTPGLYTLHSATR